MQIRAILLFLLLISTSAEAVDSFASDSLLGRAYKAILNDSLETVEIEYQQKQSIKQFQHQYGYKILLERLADGSIGYRIDLRESINKLNQLRRY